MSAYEIRACVLMFLLGGLLLWAMLVEGERQNRMAAAEWEELCREEEEPPCTES